ncbi:MAG: holo-ACP synthase [Phycisphaerales bacterium]|nr:holo-ACP synthase [Phycisphaerales bacterium]
MSIIGHGIDLVENERIERVWKQHPERFLSRILTDVERQYCERHKNPVPRIAGRFAAKEAILKVIGTGWRGQIAWTDIEITNDDAGQPHVALTGHTEEVASRLGIANILLTITHTDHYAAASAIGVSG